ncbi:MAG: tRNA (adenosine(37)-N6)-threonylcarbamoyltransferase complex dimerization subunit type 1 TsaB [Acidobacteriota bacterium]
MAGNARLLLIDTCGETAGLALCEGDKVLFSADLADRRASAEILPSLRHLLARAGWRLLDLHVIGVVRGPGSFTGVRTGLSFAKGLCESTGLRLAAVSRLEALSDAAVRATVGTPSPCLPALAALDAGRSQVYVRDIASGREWLTAVGDLQSQCRNGQAVAVAEQRLAERLPGCAVLLHSLHAGDALHAVLRRLQEGGNDVECDANYLRREADLYHTPAEPFRMGPAKAF